VFELTTLSGSEFHTEAIVISKLGRFLQLLSAWCWCSRSICHQVSILSHDNVCCTAGTFHLD